MMENHFPICRLKTPSATRKEYRKNNGQNNALYATMCIREMKLKLSIVAVFVVSLCIVLYITLLENSKWHNIPDVTAPFEKSFRDPVDGQINGGLAVQIKGNISGTAVLHTTYGDIYLADGNIDSILIGHEYWNTKCDIKYDPLTVKSGNLSIRVAIGSLPQWAQKPIMNTAPLNYKGGWRTWHPNRKHIYSRGFYADSHKNGTWSYWDEQGLLIRTEEWKEGRLIKKE